MTARRALATSFAGAVLVCFICRSLFALLLALPASAAIDASGIFRLPQADRALFEPGGLLLLELVRVEGHAISAALLASGWLFLVALVLGALPNALLFRAASLREEPLRAAWSGAVGYFGRFVVLAGLELFAWLLVCGITLVAGRQLSRVAGLGEVGTDVVAGLCLLSGLGVAGAISIVLDLVRAHTFQGERQTFLQGFSRAAASARRAAAPLASAYLCTRGLGFLLVALGARATELLDVSQESGLRLLGVGLTHQGALFGITVLRAAFALRVVRSARGSSVSPTAQERFDRSEHNGAPGDPSPSHDA